MNNRPKIKGINKAKSMVNLPILIKDSRRSNDNIAIINLKFQLNIPLLAYTWSQQWVDTAILWYKSIKLEIRKATGNRIQNNIEVRTRMVVLDHIRTIIREKHSG